MALSNEMLYFYFISLKTNFVSFDAYKKWLDQVFLIDNPIDNTKSEILLGLEFCTENIEETIDKLNVYLFDKLNVLNYQEIGKMIVNELRVQYTNNPDSLQELTHKLYNIWSLLPDEISTKKPFFILNSIDDPWSWDGEEQVLENINWLFHYYND